MWYSGSTRALGARSLGSTPSTPIDTNKLTDVCGYYVYKTVENRFFIPWFLKNYYVRHKKRNEPRYIFEIRQELRDAIDPNVQNADPRTQLLCLEI